MDRRRRSDKYISHRRCWAAKKAAPLQHLWEKVLPLNSVPKLRPGLRSEPARLHPLQERLLRAYSEAGVSAESGVPETFGLGAEEPPMSTMLPLPLPDGPHAVRKTVAANSRVPIIFFKYFIIINAEAKIPLSLLAENGRHDSGNKRPDKMLHDFRYRHNIMLLRQIQYLFVNIL